MKEAPFQSVPPSDQRVDAADLTHHAVATAISGWLVKDTFLHAICPISHFQTQSIAARISGDSSFTRSSSRCSGTAGPLYGRQIESLARTTNGTFKVNQTMLESFRSQLPPLPPPARVCCTDVSSGAVEGITASLAGETGRALRLPPAPRLPGGTMTLGRDILYAALAGLMHGGLTVYPARWAGLRDAAPLALWGRSATAISPLGLGGSKPRRWRCGADPQPATSPLVWG